MGTFTNWLVEALLNQQVLLQSFYRRSVPVLRLALPLYARLFGSPLLKRVMGPDYLLDFTQARREPSCV